MESHINKHIEEAKKWLDELDRKYPNRHKEIHKECCKHCPTNIGIKNGNPDPETEEIKGYSKEIIVKEFLFVCAWRNSKLCKGLCDYYGIDENFIKKVNE